MKFGVVVFPGTNCERETQWVLATVLQQPTELLWHERTDVSGFDCLVLPGGFAHGDYLRAGAIARFSPIMAAVAEFAARGRPVLGICNGFQVLLEAGLLPGAMLRNAHLRFRCDWVHARVETTRSPFLAALRPGQVLRLPIAHGEGNYYASPEVLSDLERHDQVALRYCDAEGVVAELANPNGSVASIAGVVNRAGNVLGLMPHPERASEPLLGSADGRHLFASLLLAGTHALTR
ncbi:MAG: phosphoribosylformylglycinamidine synthase subunit PurQ [Chloroflexi bacterium]|nr:phosphoribosylformylglycinamidine synthase subunit PurQ [Chloroflexota bacterium]